MIWILPLGLSITCLAIALWQKRKEEPDADPILTNQTLVGNHPKLFLDKRVSLREKQLEVQTLTTQLNTAARQNMLLHRHEEGDLELNYQRQSEIADNEHESLMLAHEQTHEAAIARHPYTMENIDMAGELGIDPMALDILNTTSYTNEVERRHKRILDKQENKARRDKIGVDLNAALAKHIIPYKVSRQIKTEMFQLLKERSSIEKDTSLDDKTREIALEKQDEIIRRFGQSLNGYMARHLLSPGDGEDIPGIHEE